MWLLVWPKSTCRRPHRMSIPDRRGTARVSAAGVSGARRGDSIGSPGGRTCQAGRPDEVFDGR